MDLRNAKISLESELFPLDVPKKAVKKLLKLLHDVAIGKVVSRDELAFRGKLHFSATPRQQQRSQQLQSQKPAGSSAGSSFRSSSSTSSSSKASSSSSRQGKGKIF